ncbi:protein kinase domain-containing protein [Streptomyces phytohabitans]|uniref:protein kinase domain-containing protein n=1 Tax=Streptomyces phytohabitans TaxID=1150371 RepID=UPI00345B9D08
MFEGMTRLGDADPRRLGPYRLHGVLGSGALGTVYAGRGTPGRGGRRRSVAVRALRPELLRDRSLRARLRHVTRTLADEVASPYVAGALDCELDGERPWLAGELVPGTALATLVARYGPLPEPGLRAVGGAVARALAALHAVGVPHGDLRAANVLLTSDTPRVVDHGLGTVVGDRGSDDGTVEPTAADLFDLGALLCHAAGARPSPGGPASAARAAPDVTAVPEALRPALLACLRAAPGARPEAHELARLLDPAGRAEREATEWLPEAYLDEIVLRAQDVRESRGRRFLGR